MSKLNGNGIWEGSRFILPEHREMWLSSQYESTRRQRPTLDEQEWEQIGDRLQQAMRDRETITLQMYDPFEQCQLTAQVIDIDPQGRRVKLLLDGEKQWVSIDDILNVQ
ncbi:YolD-like family protein [Paenibacillus alvei]|uniref:YolD-like family protein n=1 Tax=Paenibacillus alvei TaxID=44250 RepID=A0ABT4H0E8_PAEAL|nr:YolD-like family protein [Paenibacillus alvei]EJW14660.1 YolD-like protein [Paenibacillus alvei DSM 29]MCY9545223.1 YolD-like family protein [Paenibacillus alvei]MCY9708049.1 YolD-like family protein [Paenibacillus alvei]MCY9733871.1 YolD-like family protein [Paenibacillus alvei]MCY9758520.1 YolD-like family protein [Paenibacillus alvei]